MFGIKSRIFKAFDQLQIVISLNSIVVKVHIL